MSDPKDHFLLSPSIVVELWQTSHAMNVYVALVCADMTPMT
jgi:hypothetical protein